MFSSARNCTGIFANFKNVVDTGRVKVPFGIAQIGKAFRNEITPRNFIFRSREFEQMEIEYFIPPGDDEWKKFQDEWISIRKGWFSSIGLTENFLGERFILGINLLIMLERVLILLSNFLSANMNSKELLQEVILILSSTKNILEKTWNILMKP